MMEGENGYNRHQRQDPQQRNITLGDDADEHGGQYEQNEIEDVEDVNARRGDELLGGEWLHRHPLVDLLAVELSASH